MNFDKKVRMINLGGLKSKMHQPIKEPVCWVQMALIHPIKIPVGRTMSENESKQLSFTNCQPRRLFSHFIGKGRRPRRTSMSEVKRQLRDR